MSFLRVSKQTRLVLVFGLLIVCALYFASMGRADSYNGSLAFTDPILHPLYIGETGLTNPVKASGLFTSTYTFGGGEGCPCAGIFKPVALLAMLTTWQFYANWLIFSIIFYASYSLLRMWIKLC